MEQQRLIQQFEKYGIKPEHLDKAVHNTANDMASNANNGGISEQVMFLRNAGWDDQEILAAAKRELS